MGYHGGNPIVKNSYGISFDSKNLIGVKESGTSNENKTIEGAEMLAWDDNTIKTNLGEEFTVDVQNEDGTWKYNEGYPTLRWQIEQ